MNKPKIEVNQHNIETIRESLRLPLFQLIAHMDKLGWKINIKTPDKHQGFVFFKKSHEWHGRPMFATTCSYGYRYEALSDEALLHTAQRAAELCLTVYETFGKWIPSTPNIYGIIRVDSIINEPKYLNESYDEFTKDKYRYSFILSSSSKHNSKVFGNFYLILLDY